MKILAVLALSCAAVALPAPAIGQGDLEPPGPPGQTGKSLQQIYDALVASSDGLQFLGVSTTVSSASGILGLTAQCKVDFGPSARVCTSEEIILGTNVPDLADWNGMTRAWVVPTFVGSFELHGIDMSGLSAPGASFTCSGWSRADAAASGLIVNRITDVDASFTFFTCTPNIGAACCGVGLP